MAGLIRKTVGYCAAIWVLLSSAPAAELDWDPGRTWVFAVGILEWRDSDVWPGMPSAKVDRRDVKLVDQFREAGVSADRIVYLQDRAATLQKIQSSFKTHLSKTRPGDFANYDAVDGDSVWAVGSVFDSIETHFRGDRALLLADCCYSGGRADEARRRGGKLACACLCSAFSHNGSTGAWTFTDTLLAGLDGNVRPGPWLRVHVLRAQIEAGRSRCLKAMPPRKLATINTRMKIDLRLNWNQRLWGCGAGVVVETNSTMPSISSSPSVSAFNYGFT